MLLPFLKVLAYFTELKKIRILKGFVCLEDIDEVKPEGQLSLRVYKGCKEGEISMKTPQERDLWLREIEREMKKSEGVSRCTGWRRRVAKGDTLWTKTGEAREDVEYAIQKEYEGI